MNAVRWTRVAVDDLTGICDFLEARASAAVAQKVSSHMLKRLEALSTFPGSGRPGRKNGTRELVFTGLPYLAVYRLREGVVEILRILHGAQRWP